MKHTFLTRVKKAPTGKNTYVWRITVPKNLANYIDLKHDDYISVDIEILPKNK